MSNSRRTPDAIWNPNSLGSTYNQKWLHFKTKMAPPFGSGHHRFGAGHLGVMIGCWTHNRRTFERHEMALYTYSLWTPFLGVKRQWHGCFLIGNLWNFAFSGKVFSDFLQSWEEDSVHVWGIKWHPRYPSYMPGSKKPRIFISVPRKIGGAICPPPCRNRLAPTPCRNRVKTNTHTRLACIIYSDCNLN